MAMKNEMGAGGSGTSGGNACLFIGTSCLWGGRVIGVENLTMVSAALDSRPIDPDINRGIDIHGRVQRAHRVVCSFRKMGRWRGKQMERPISSGVRCFSRLPLLFPCYFTKIIPGACSI